jgi:hypothetical protein
MPKHMEPRGGITGLTADLLRRAGCRAAKIGQAGAGQLD